MSIKILRQKRATFAARGKAATTEYNALQAVTARTAEQDTQLATLNAELTSLEIHCDALDIEITAEEASIRRAALFQTAGVSALAAGRVSDPSPGMFGFNAAAEFYAAVRTASMNQGFDPRLNGPDLGAAAPTNFEQNVGSAGEGFLVPPELRTEIWNLVFEGTDLVDMCDKVETNSNSISLPKDETTPWGAAGVQAAWASEGNVMTPSKIAMGQLTVQLHELRVFVAATNELMADAPRLQNALTVQAARAIRWRASDAIIWGDGNGKPLGIQNSGALIVQPKDGGQATKTLSVNNLLNMMSRLYRTGGGSPFWLVNPDVLPQLGQLAIGTVPAWLPLNQPIAGSPWEGTLLGRPVMFSEHAQSLTAQGDVNLLCLDTGYMLLTKAGGGIDYAASIHLWFDYNLAAFRWIFRLGGQPYLSAPYAAANGPNTKSHFITLQAR